MGTPSSAMVSEISLQHTESNYMMEILIANKIFSYSTFVDDVLIFIIILVDINSVLDTLKHVNPNLNFTTQLENNSKINYPDLTIHRHATHLSLAYSKNKLNKYSKYPLYHGCPLQLTGKFQGKKQ